MSKKVKWRLSFCTSCRKYDACANYRTHCRCKTEYQRQVPCDFTDELELHEWDYNNAPTLKSTSSGILYPMSLKTLLRLFKEFVHGKITRTWSWRNSGGITKVYPAKKQQSGGIFG